MYHALPACQELLEQTNLPCRGVPSSQLGARRALLQTQNYLNLQGDRCNLNRCRRLGRQQGLCVPAVDHTDRKSRHCMEAISVPLLAAPTARLRSTAPQFPSERESGAPRDSADMVKITETSAAARFLTSRWRKQQCWSCSDSGMYSAAWFPCCVWVWPSLR